MNCTKKYERADVEKGDFVANGTFKQTENGEKRKTN